MWSWRQNPGTCSQVKGTLYAGCKIQRPCQTPLHNFYQVRELHHFDNVTSCTVCMAQQTCYVSDQVIHQKYPKARNDSSITKGTWRKERIAWEFAFGGYLSSKWATVQQSKHPCSTPERIQQQWLSSIIKELWNFQFTLWEWRNKKLH